MSNWRAWVIVGRGLELKLAGLILFAGLPLLSALLWSSESDPRWLLLGVGLAAAPYFVGRCLCLAAPPQVRLSVILSVVFQVFAFVALAGFGYTDGVGEFGAGILVVVGILVAGGLQLASAVLFTRFLRSAGEVLGHPEVSDRADQLSCRLACSLASSSGLGCATNRNIEDFSL